MIEHEPQNLIGDAPAFRRVVKAARMVAPTDANVLLIGEGGTGKEVLAREINRYSRRGGGFHVVKCAGMAAAGSDRGLDAGFEGAGGGTLFLDEVGELPAQAQARLLYLLECGAAAVAPRCRVIAATSGDLWESAQAGGFREDLYYRLCVVPLELPPLRDRVQDIAPLMAGFLRSLSEGHGLEPPRFSAPAERQLRRYAWPGNVRELRNFCERMLILFPDRDLCPENLPWEVRRGAVARDEAVGFKLPATGINLRDLEVEVIRQALALAGGNKSQAARLLGVTRDTLLYRIQKYLIKA